ncbi:MAG: hypothetical protein ACK56I_07815, partial [bacterium]
NSVMIRASVVELTPAIACTAIPKTRQYCQKTCTYELCRHRILSLTTPADNLRHLIPEHDQ